MPAGTGASGSSGGNERTVFRPPWVKETPPTTAVSSAPWLKNRQQSKAEDDSQPPKFPQLRKTSGPQPKQNGKTSPPPINQVQLRPTPKEVPIKINGDDSVDEKPNFLAQKTLLKKPKERIIKPTLRAERPMTRTRTFDKEDIPSSHTLRKQDSILNIMPPMIPPAPPAPPCPPPPPKMIPEGHTPLNTKQAKVIESLRLRPRARPDWGTLLKDVEAGRKLKHVVCNDRSKPLLPSMKSKTKDGQFLYESEKEKKDSDPHHVLLKQIQSGVQLKRVQTNDRSKPILDGLRKFRRQMTIEEQIQKSQSSVKLGAVPIDDDDDMIVIEGDEMDDIDKLRDDLQSTKQLLALELRNKEAQQKEAKRLQLRISNLEVELAQERGKAAAAVTRSVLAERMGEDVLVTSLKQECADAREAAKDSEKKYIKCSDELDTIKGELDEAKRQNEIMERKLEAALKALNGGGSRRQSQAPSSKEGDEEAEEEEDISESDDDDDDGEETEEKIEKRAKREIKILTNKLKNVKDKKENAKKERQSLKTQMKKEQQTIKDERKKFKKLQQEVDKMADLMQDDANEEIEDDEEKDLDDDEELSVEEEEETESESESSSESEEEEESESEPEDAPNEKRQENYTQRCRRHENQVAALKKGNYLLKANIDRLKDDINKQREMSLHLQQDLDSVLNDLG